MARNDVVLLDHAVREAAATYDKGTDVFETLALQQVLKDRDISTDDVALGIVDGRADGGVDAWYTFVDGELVTERADIPSRRVATIELLIFTCKHHDTFRQEPVVSLYTAASELLNLGIPDHALADRYNEEVLHARPLFYAALTETATANPQLRIRMHYLSRGDTAHIGAEVRARAARITELLNELFSQCDAAFIFLGSAELMEAIRKRRSFSAKIRFREGPLSRGSTNYTALCRSATTFVS